MQTCRSPSDWQLLVLVSNEILPALTLTLRAVAVLAQPTACFQAWRTGRQPSTENIWSLRNADPASCNSQPAFAEIFTLQLKWRIPPALGVSVALLRFSLPPLRTMQVITATLSLFFVVSHSLAFGAGFHVTHRHLSSFQCSLPFTTWQSPLSNAAVCMKFLKFDLIV